METLTCGVQQYQWGKKTKESKVASLLKQNINESNADDRYAELWIGVHTKLPSTLASNPQLTLKDFILQNKTKYLTDTHTNYFLGKKNSEPMDIEAAYSIPFLLKVLSIDIPLSIQAHPSRSLAKVLHIKDPKNYPDQNHKPELVVALSPFEALCCFRPISEVVHFLRQSGPFRELVGAEMITILEKEAEIDAESNITPLSCKAALKAALQSIYAVKQEVLDRVIPAHIDLIQGSNVHGNNSLDDVHDVFIRTAKHFNNDVGLWMFYFLNYIRLAPGNGLFLRNSEPHAYISGDAVEIMANSDNVVRAGLTSKFKDISTLLDMMTYDTKALNTARLNKCVSGSPVQEYAPPNEVDDFSLHCIRLNPEVKTVNITFPSVCLGICVSGKCSAISSADSDKRTLEYGDCFTAPPNQHYTFKIDNGYYEYLY
eukprot:Tbor_TRINITY_DN5463_c1_g1::TRINITY_DN5463_c1_g1_i4::g.25064::m.25064/K01809/manA, MPI; mannose-6-phosphate isomerase